MLKEYIFKKVKTIRKYFISLNKAFKINENYQSYIIFG